MTRIGEDRIVRSASIDPHELIAHEGNWRVHSDDQRSAMRAVLDDIGWVQRIVVNELTGHIIDGHLRAELAIESGIETVPVIYVNLSEEEEALALATFDAVGLAADVDGEALKNLISELDSDLFASLSSDALINIHDDLTQPLESWLNAPDPPEPVSGDGDSDVVRFIILAPRERKDEIYKALSELTERFDEVSLV